MRLLFVYLFSQSSTTCPIDRKRFNSVTVMRRIGEEPFLRLEFDARSLPLQPMDPELMTCVVRIFVLNLLTNVIDRV